MTTITINNGTMNLSFEVNSDLAMEIIGLCFAKTDKQAETIEPAPKKSSKKTSSKKTAETGKSQVEEAVAKLPKKLSKAMIEARYKIWEDGGWTRPNGLVAKAVDGISYTINEVDGGVNWTLKDGRPSKAVSQTVVDSLKAAGFKWNASKKRWYL